MILIVNVDEKIDSGGLFNRHYFASARFSIGEHPLGLLFSSALTALRGGIIRFVRPWG